MKFLVNWTFGNYLSEEELQQLDFISFGFKGFDIELTPEEYTAETIVSRIPEGWEPECSIFFYPEYHPIPLGMECLPFKSIAVISDWNCGLLTLQKSLSVFDHIFVDVPGVKLFQRMGFRNASFWPAYSFNRSWHYKMDNVPKRYDITFIGNLNPTIHQKRNRLLSQVLKLSDRYAVNVDVGIRGEAYGRMLNDSKIVFNCSVRGEFNMRCYEALACGALLFLEADNLEAASIVSEESLVLYREDNLVELLLYYLEHDEERQRKVQKGLQEVQEHDYLTHFYALQQQISQLSLANSRHESVGHFKVHEQMQQWFYSTYLDQRQMNFLFEKVYALIKKCPDEVQVRNTALFLQLFRAEQLAAGSHPDVDFRPFVKSFKELVDQFPGYMPAYLNLLRALMNARLFEMAVKVAKLGATDLLSRDIELADFDGLTMSPMDYYQDNFMQQKSRLYSELYNADMNQLLLQLKLLYLGRFYELEGEAQVMLGEHAKAVVCYEKSWHSFARPGTLQLKLMREARKMGDYELAAKWAGRYVEGNPINLSAQREYVEILLELGYQDECRIKCQELLTILSGYGVSGLGKMQIDRSDQILYCQDVLNSLSQKAVAN